MTTANYYDIFPDKTFYSAPINGPTRDPTSMFISWIPSRSINRGSINRGSINRGQLIEAQLIGVN